jgi:hypothetical protein
VIACVRLVAQKVLAGTGLFLQHLNARLVRSSLMGCRAKALVAFEKEPLVSTIRWSTDADTGSVLPDVLPKTKRIWRCQASDFLRKTPGHLVFEQARAYEDAVARA